MNIVLPNVSLLTIAAAVKVASLDGGSLRLFQNDITPGFGNVLADFTVADFAGYANKTVATWDAAYIDPTGAVVSLAPLQLFTCSGGGTTNNIFGAYYLDSTGNLVWAARFADAPYAMALATDALPFVPRFLFAQVPLN